MTTVMTKGIRPPPAKDGTPPATNTHPNVPATPGVSTFQPIQVFRYGSVSAAIFHQSWKFARAGKPSVFISLRKSSRDECGWHSTHSLSPDDVPLAIVALQKCYEWLTQDVRYPSAATAASPPQP